MTGPVPYDRLTGAQKKLARGVQVRGVDGVMLRPKLAEKHRASIQATMIIKRLTSFITGDIEMSSAQVSAAKALLNKIIPDLSSVQLAADFKDPDDQDIRERLVSLSKKLGLPLPAGMFELEPVEPVSIDGEVSRTDKQAGRRCSMRDCV